MRELSDSIFLAKFLERTILDMTEPTYEDLAPSSLNGGSQLSNGLQTTAIYWENWQTPFRGLFGGLYGGKWSWKTLDDDIRKFLRLDCEPSGTDSMVFWDVGTLESSFARKYEGAPEFSTIVAARKRPNFSFFPAGTNKL